MYIHLCIYITGSIVLSLLVNVKSFCSAADQDYKCPLILELKGLPLKNDTAFLLQICPKLYYYIHEYACFMLDKPPIFEKLTKIRMTLGALLHHCQLHGRYRYSIEQYIKRNYAFKEKNVRRLHLLKC